MRISADLLAVRDLAAFLRTACARAGISEAETADLELALVEAANNVVEHGHADGGGEIELALFFSREAVQLVLSDEGMPAPDGTFDAACDVGPEALSGRGIGIIHACVDEIRYASSGGHNRLSLTRRRAA